VRRVRAIDSHTEGEPTRVIVDGGPDVRRGAARARAALADAHWSFCRSVVLEPRGSDVLVGALLVEPEDSSCCAGAVFFNNVGVLGMCGHGTIGIARTLMHLGRIGIGTHTLETPVGAVPFEIHSDGSVSLRNVASRRERAGEAVDAGACGVFTGDIAWGGNWFFITRVPPGVRICRESIGQLERMSVAIQAGLDARGLGMREPGAADPARIRIDHVELWEPGDSAREWRSFTMCPGGQWDRSPCGTGTSAKLACLAASGGASAGERWHAVSPIGTRFESWFDAAAVDGSIRPHVRGRAWITAECELLFEEGDPCTR
jgi:4-hydroxyproline epimerase